MGVRVRIEGAGRARRGFAGVSCTWLDGWVGSGWLVGCGWLVAAITQPNSAKKKLSDVLVTHHRDTKTLKKDGFGEKIPAVAS